MFCTRRFIVQILFILGYHLVWYYLLLATHSPHIFFVCKVVLSTWISLLRMCKYRWWSEPKYIYLSKMEGVIIYRHQFDWENGHRMVQIITPPPPLKLASMLFILWRCPFHFDMNDNMMVPGYVLKYCVPRKHVITYPFNFDHAVFLWTIL
jgi:hypothetical protein